MALTLGLDTALSGLLTAQQALNIVSQNISNVDTVGYTRKTVNQQAVTLNGQGAGVQIGSVGRPVDQQVLKNIRTQNSVIGQLNSDQKYYSQIDNLFGQVGDGTSISDTLTSLSASFESLSTTVSDPSQQFSTVQSALDTTSQLNSMTTTLQNLRVQADNQISTDVTQINNDLTNISSLNSKIVSANAVGADTSGLKDQIDTAINDLSNYMNVSYYQAGNGAVNVFTGAGQALVTTSQTNLLTHPAANGTNATMTAAAGNFAPITLGSGNTDISGSISGGELSSLIAMRDTTIPNLQAQLDETASQLQSTINQISNRGTSQPALASSYSGTHIFATQGGVTPESGTTATLVSAQNGQSLTSTLTGAAAGGYGTLSFGYSAVSGQITISGTTANSLAGLRTPGSTFTVTGAANSGNDGTYTVTGYDSASNTLTVSQANPIQTFSLAGGADTAITLFDSSGNQIATTTLNTVMTTDYSSNYTAGSQAAAQATAQDSGGPWSINSFSEHMQSWLQAQGYAGATVGLDSTGHMNINLGSTAQASLAFRDQASSTPGSTAQDATINFDANGDGTTDQTVQGFSNFFGLNDVFTAPQGQATMDSAILPAGFTEPATTPQRTLALSDPSGQLGPTMTIAAGSTLQDIADEINSFTQTNDSAPQQSASITLSSQAVFTVQGPNGVLESQNFGPGTVTLQDMAAKLTNNSVTAQVVQSGGQYQLRLSSNSGQTLSTSITGGAVAGSSTITLANQLDMVQDNHVRATVVPEGSGYRLRVVQTSGSALYAAGNQDSSGGNIMGDLGLTTAASGTAGDITVRASLQSNPSTVPRGAVEWNPDTGKYYLSEGDNATALQMAAAMSGQVSMQSAGQIGNGSYTFAQYAADSISLVAQAASNTQTQQTSQQTLSDSLNYQYTSTSGVNLDEEVANLTSYQQAYAASARVISTLDSMLSDLLSIVK